MLRRSRAVAFFRPASRGSSILATTAVIGVRQPRQPRMSLNSASSSRSRARSTSKLLGGRSLGRIVDVDRDQTGALETLELLQHRQVLNWPGWWCTAHFGDTRQHPRTHVLRQAWTLAHKVSDRHAHDLLHPRGHPVGLTEYLLPGICLGTLGRSDVPLATHVQRLAREWNRCDEYLQVGVARGGCHPPG